MSFYVADDNRLSVKSVVLRVFSVAAVTYRNFSFAERSESVLSENVVYQSAVLYAVENTVVVYYNAAAFLSSVL